MVMEDEEDALIVVPEPEIVGTGKRKRAAEETGEDAEAKRPKNSTRAVVLD